MDTIRVLAADDHPILLDGLKAFLGIANGIDLVGTAGNGAQVMEMMHRNRIDVVILDISMPVMDGLETAKEIRKLYPNTKILLLSMINDQEMMHQSRRLGVDGYVVKEKSGDVLIGAIHSVWRGGGYWPLNLNLPPNTSNSEDSEQDKEEVRLTAREKEILKILVDKPTFTAKKIGEHLYISAFTVEKHISNMKRKLNMTKVTELIKYALDNRICA